MNIKEYLDGKSIGYREINGQLNLKKSMCCGDNKWGHFYINFEGLWDCKKCMKKGNFNQFRGLFGDEGIQSELSIPIEGKAPAINYEASKAEVRKHTARLHSVSPDELKYLQGRGFSLNTIKHFKFGVDGVGRITIPIYDEENKCVNIRTRKNVKDKTDSPRYLSPLGGKLELFNGTILDQKIKPHEVYLTEGEFDATALYEAGITNVVGNSGGAGYIGKNWMKRFKGVNKIYIVYDTDEEGAKGIKRVLDYFGAPRCRVVNLPKPKGVDKVDLNDYFLAGNKKEDFLKLVKRTAPENLDEIKHISEFNDELRTKILEGDYTGISTGFDELDKIMGGYRKARLIIVSGLTSAGKTTLAGNFTLSLANRQHPVMFVSMEMPPIDICKRFLMIIQKLTNQILDGVKDPSKELEEIDKGLAKFKGSGGILPMPVYLFNGSGAIALENVLNSIRTAKQEYNIDIAVIDHLHYFGYNSGNRATEIAKIVRDIKALCIELDIPIIVLAHLNRGGRAMQRKGFYLPTLADLKDAGAIEQDADQVLFIARDSEAKDENDRKRAILKVAKNRDGPTGHISLNLNTEVGVFEETLTEDYMETLMGTGKGVAGGPMVDPKTLGIIETKPLPF